MKIVIKKLLYNISVKKLKLVIKEIIHSKQRIHNLSLKF